MAYETINIPLALRGLNKDLEPIDIIGSSPNMKNMIVDVAKVRKRLGYAVFGGSNLENNLVGHWKMNDNAASTVVVDSVTGGTNGTAQQNTNVITTAGKISTALSFNGSSDYITMGDTLDFTATADFTLTAWIKFSAGTGRRFIIAKGGTADATGSAGYWLAVNTNERIEAGLTDVSGTNVLGTSASNVNDGSWHYVAATFDRDGNCQIYIDGSADGASFYIGSEEDLSNTDALIIGRKSDTAAGYFNGDIDNVAIFDRALTATEISVMYNSGSGTETFSALNGKGPVGGIGMELIQYVDARGTTHLIMLTTTNAYLYNVGNQEWDKITPTSADFTGGADNRFSHTVIHDAAYFGNNGGTALLVSNGIDDVAFYEGDSSDVFEYAADNGSKGFGLANFASAKEVAEFWNHLMYLNYNDASWNARSVVVADLGDVDDWTGGTSTSATLTDSRGNIVRAKKMGADLMVYSDHSITTCRYLGGLALFTWPTLVRESGLFAPKAIWDFVNVHYFLGTDQKVYAYSGAQQLTQIGNAIEDSLFQELDISKKAKIVMGVDAARHKLYIFFPKPGDTYSKSAYVLDYKHRPMTWEYHEFGNTVRDFSIFSNRNDWYADGPELSGTYADEMAFYADASFTQQDYPTAVFLSDDGRVFELNEATGKDDTSNIECIYETHDVSLQKGAQRMRIIWVGFDIMSTIPSATYKLWYSTDGGVEGSWTQILDDSTSNISIASGSANKWEYKRLPVDISSRTVRFKFSQNSNKDIQLRGDMHLKAALTTDRD